ncbi:unnamed protein product [Phyllotreta striolata]|uniref:Centrosome-associated protein 350 n=1 Tax=Phyllotreta striolata TaxID=444603 RepID=A0A9N9TP39_PHYSR|nr:unnamed protein product [Phyllotreta striolata]
MSGDSSTTKKISRTKLQTKILQQELEKLIDEGRNLICPSARANADEEAACRPPAASSGSSENKVQILKSYDKHSVHIPSTKVEDKSPSPKKERRYNVEDAREFIKKQKEKSQVRKQIETLEENRVKELKKQKLDDLARRSRDIIKKNVELREKRAKSKDPSEYVRPSDTNLKRSKSLNKINTSPKKTTLEIPKKIVILKSNCTKTVTEKVKSANKNSPKPLTPKVAFKSSEEIYSNEILTSPKSSNEKCKHSSHNLNSYKLNIPLNVPDLETVEKPNPIIIDSPNNPPVQTVQLEEPFKTEPPRILITTDHDLKKCNAEIRTEATGKIFPKWLEEQPPLAHPFNFMNTVKRKLQFAANQKTTMDKCVQSSVLEQQMNLRTRSIENLELLSSRDYQEINTLFRNSKPPVSTEIESESDTSKNIPEISSESGTSLKKNAEFVKRGLVLNKNVPINTDKIDSMKLVPNIVTDTVTIKNKPDSIKTNNLLSPCIYSNDFESDVHITPDKLDRSRRSIISSNKSEYDLMIVSPEFVKTNSTTKSDNIPTSNAINTNLDISAIKYSSSDDKSNADSHKLSRSKQTVSDPQLPTASISKSEQCFQYVNTTRGSSSFDNSRKTRTDQASTGHCETAASKSELSLQYVNTKRGLGSSNRTSAISTRNSDDEKNSQNKLEVLHTVDTKSNPRTDASIVSRISSARNVNTQRSVLISQSDNGNSKKIVIKSDVPAVIQTVSKEANQVHLKFEAEIHLINDFNNSLKKISEVEEDLKTLKTKNFTSTHVIQNKSCTSIESGSKSSKISENVLSARTKNSNVCYSRGSFMDKYLNDMNILSNTALDLENSVVSTTIQQNIEGDENLPVNIAGVSVNMFDQIIKDEDARLENLKTVLKIREKALLDRTKGELAWLEIQRKHFKETGQFQEASAIKKKQRCILLNHQKEQHEMQRLKQMQQAASIERKMGLKEQRNLIRQQLSTNNMLKMKVSSSRGKHRSGPLKVVQSHTESVRTETSISLRNSSDNDKDMFSFTSHNSVVSEISEIEISTKEIVPDKRQVYIKKKLLLREEELKKRRKAAEDLLEWHKKLLEEEKRIAILESIASAIISQKPGASASSDKIDFKGEELNQLWSNLSDSKTNKFADDKVYPMSKVALERFCTSAHEYSKRKKKSVELAKHSDKEYHSDFESESGSSRAEVHDQSIDILINNFSKIQDDICNLSTIQSVKSDTPTEESFPSVIETDVKNTEKSEEAKENLEENTEESDASISTASASIPVNKNKNSSAEEHLSAILPLEKSVSIEENLEQSEEDVPKTTSSTKEPTGSANIQTSLSKSAIDEKTEDDDKTSITNETKESLNKSQEILEILGEHEIKANSSGDEVSKDQLKDSLNASKEILSHLSVEAAANEDLKSESFLQLQDICKTEEQLNLSNTSDVFSRISFESQVDEILEDQADEIVPESTEAPIAIPGKSSEESSVISSRTGEDAAKEPSGDVNLNIADDLEDASSKISERLIEEASKDDEQIEFEKLEEISSKISDLELKSDINEEISNNVDSTKVSDDIKESIIEDAHSVASKITQELEPTSNSNLEIKSIIVGEGLSENNSEVPAETGEKSIESSKVSEEINKEATNINEELTKDEAIEDLEEAIGNEDLEEPSLQISEHLDEKSAKIGVDSISQSTEESPAVEEASATSRRISSASREIEEELKLKIDDSSTIRTFINNLVASAAEIRETPVNIDEADDSKLASSDKSNESFVINDINDDDLHAKETPRDETNDSSSIAEDVEEESSKITSHFSYGVLQKSPDREVSDSFETDVSASKEDEIFEEKEHDSLSSVNGGSSAEALNLEEQSVSSKSDEALIKSKTPTVDVKTRVSEILAETSVYKGDKSPRLQELYVTTYDVISPASSPEKEASPKDDHRLSSIFDSEAKEILRKQLAVEEEIKAITEQQQKEQQLPLLYLREIPNKPPPPYTPPTSQAQEPALSIIPTCDQLEEISSFSAKILHKGYLAHNLANVAISNNVLSLITEYIPKDRYKFVFDLCKEIACEHYAQFKEDNPSFGSGVRRPLDAEGLQAHMLGKLKEVFGYKKTDRRDNAVIKWSRKKRDHVDEVLVTECQREEPQWINYQKDELLVKEQIANDIFEGLLRDTANVFKGIFSKLNS